MDQQQAEALLYEASYCAATQLVRDGHLEEAIEAFSELSSPYASMQQALVGQNVITINFLMVITRTYLCLVIQTTWRPGATQ